MRIAKAQKMNGSLFVEFKLGVTTNRIGGMRNLLTINPMNVERIREGK